MRIRRRLPLVFAVLLIAAAVALAVVLRKHAPPEPARLLPSADGFAYVSLRWMRRTDVAGKLPAVPHDPEYERFIQETGFQFERDLDQAAVAIHYPDPATGKSAEVRFSEVFVGKIDGERLRAYLRKISSSTELEGATEIFDISLEGRTLRVAILGPDIVAASNNSDPSVIRGIIARSRKLASPFGGPELLRQYYKHIPLGSLAWIICRTGTSSSNAGFRLPFSFDFSFLFPKPAVIVGSVRYIGAVHFRAEAFTGAEDIAQHVTEQLKTFSTIFTSAQKPNSAMTDADLQQLFNSLKIEQRKERVVVTANVSTNFIRKLVAEVPNEVDLSKPEAPLPSLPNSKPAQRKRGHL